MRSTRLAALAREPSPHPGTRLRARHSIPGLCLTLLASTLAGCFNAPYPKDWGALPPPGDRCPDISGAFVDKGEGGGSLGEWLVPEALQGHPGHHVVITQVANGDITVTVWRERLFLEGDTPVKKLQAAGEKTFRYGKGDFQCRDGSVAFVGSLSCVSAEQVLVGCDKGYQEFRKTADGALVAKVGGTGFGVVLVIPVATSGSDWTRFKPYVPDDSVPH
jgi:hypothetical protein